MGTSSCWLDPKAPPGMRWVARRSTGVAFHADANSMRDCGRSEHATKVPLQGRGPSMRSAQRCATLNA
eukprot:6034184-Prymnesium_polylepis.1